MTKIEVDVFSESVNSPVLRMPGRKFPGVLIQGDSLKVMLDFAREIADLNEKRDAPEIADAAHALAEILSSYLNEYERTLRQHHHPLPYVRQSD